MTSLFDTHIVRLFPYALIPLMCSLFIFLITISAFARSYRSHFARLIFIFCFTLGLWSASSAFLITTPVPEWAEIAKTVYLLSWLSLPPVFLFAALTQTNRSLIFLLPVSAIFGFFAVWLTVFDNSRLVLFYFGYYPAFELPSGIVIMVVYYFTVAAGLLMLWDEYREAKTSTGRNQARLLWMGATIGFLISIPETLLLISSQPVTYGNKTTPENILTVIIATVLICIAYSISLLLLRINKLKGSDISRNRRLSLVLLLLILPFISLAMPVLSRTVYSIYPVSGIGMILGTIIIIYASMKYRLMDITEIFRKYLIYYFMLALWMIAFISFISMFTNRENMAPVIFAGIFLIIIFNPSYQFLHRLSDRVIFRHRYDYQKTLKDISSQLVTVLDFDKLLELIRDSIVNVMKASSFSLFLYQHDTDCFKMVTKNRNFQGCDLEYNASDPTIKIIMLANRPIYLEELSEGTEDIDVEEYTSLFVDTGSVLVVPMAYKGTLRGIMCLGDKESGEIYTSRDVELLETLANQAIIAVDNARLYELAITDELTNLYIIRFFNQRIVGEIIRCIRMKRTLSLLMIDIDFFKSVNDNYGHQVGDVILKEVAAIIEEEVRAIDLVARYGGEEFAVILPETDNYVAEKIADRIRGKIDDFDFAENINLTVSIGIASLDGSLPSPTFEMSLNLNPVERKKFFSELKETFIYHADKALYRAKEKGRNRIENNGVLEI